MASNQTGTDDRVRYNADKVAIYGFRPLEMSFMGYNRQGNTDSNDLESVENTTKKLNELAEYWYSRNDEMYSGNITIITDFKNPETNPRVGCRAKFLNGEFYINRVDHTWTYGAAPTIKLQVSRGMMYDNRNGIMGNCIDIDGLHKEMLENTYI